MTEKSKDLDSLLQKYVTSASDRSSLLESIEELTDHEARTIELYRLEYERASERYENIYKAIWTNFSYMSIISGAILTFGSNFYPNATFIAFLTCLPLLFWYFSTFVPMNSYGYWTADRLGKIEETLNDEFNTDLNHYRGFRKHTGFWEKFRPRVGSALLIVFLLLSIMAVYFLNKYLETPPYLHSSDLLISNTSPLISNLSNPSIPTTSSNTDDVKLMVQREIYASIRNRLGENTSKSLSEFMSSVGGPTTELQKNLASDLNKVLASGPLYNARSRLALDNPDDVAPLFENAKKPEDIVKANRLFLEGLFPANIEPLSNRLLMNPDSYMSKVVRWSADNTSWVATVLVVILVILAVRYFLYAFWQLAFQPAKGSRTQETNVGEKNMKIRLSRRMKNLSRRLNEVSDQLESS